MHFLVIYKNMKIFQNHGDIFNLKTNLGKISGEINSLIAWDRDLPGKTDWGLGRDSSAMSWNFYQIHPAIEDDYRCQSFSGFTDLSPNSNGIM